MPLSSHLIFIQSLQTVAVVSMFLLAILKNPEVLRKAQREVDEVVGPNRLPGFEDRDKLPYSRFNAFRNVQYVTELIDRRS